MIIYGAPLVFLLGAMLIHQMKSHAKTISTVLQTIAVLLGGILAVGLVARLPGADALAKVEVVDWTRTLACASNEDRDTRRSLEQFIHDYDLDSN